MIVGKDRGGKTSVKKHLLGQPFDDKEPSTEGIDVHMVELTDKSAADPWCVVEKETKLLASPEEAEDELLKGTAKLVIQGEQERAGVTSSNSESLYRKVPTSKQLDKIEKLCGENTPSEKMINGKSITVFIHDFAGQSIFYDTHFCFLKMQCPYLLIIDCSLSLEDLAEPRYESLHVKCDVPDPFLATNLDHFVSWLTVLARLTKAYRNLPSDDYPNFKLPPVLIALTNSDQCKDITEVKKIIQDTLIKKKLPNVFLDIYVIDNTLSDRNGKEIRRLRLKLYELCKSILECQKPMPVRWLQLEVALGEMLISKGLKHIPIEDCHRVAQSCNVVNIEAAITFLHHQGIIVHHSESKVVVLDPPWLMNLFTKVITIPDPEHCLPIDAETNNLLLTKGILMPENLRKTIDGELLEDLMKQFSLICPSTDNGQPAYIVPSLAPLMKKGVSVEEKLSKSEIVPVFVQFENWGYVPPGFFTRLQTTMVNSYREKLDEETTMVNSCRGKLDEETPIKLFGNYTLFNFTYGEFSFGVYLIKIPAKIKVGVLPLDSSSEQDNCKFVSFLKHALKDCMQQVKKDESLIYHNVKPSLFVKCCNEKDNHCCRHGSECDRDECANFLSLEELQGCKKDPVCPHNSVCIKRFALKSVKHWLYTDTGTFI